ncbi:MAG TPA: hypothetical protein VNY07_06395 [Chthoniobacterales bacterium]|jgi:hypothetical protein|nr:hypothetical protein [Chthoniobacterales bacterium]
MITNTKVPFGTAKGVALRGVRYLQWEDAFEVDFEDGVTFLEPHATIRKANKISPKATVQRVELEDELKHGFFVHYDNGQTAEVSWSFVRELAPEKFTRRGGPKNSK